jgi:hypothetical protein
MIQVAPQIKLKDFARAGRVYAPRRVALTGMRWMIEAESSDGHILWKDFPASHGLYTPCIYDPATRAVEGIAGFEWWSDPLKTPLETPRLENTNIKVHRRRDHCSWIVLNTLDTIFGHSLLLLFNAQFYLERFPQHGLIVVATPELMRYIPQNVAEIWEVQCAPRDTERWHTKLEALFAERCQTSEVWIASAPNHPDPSRYDIRTFGLAPAQATSRNPSAPRIVFVYRGTRLWGGSWAEERSRLARLGHWLHQFWPRAILEIVGHARLSSNVEGWTDATRKNESDYDARLLEFLAGADLVLGAHGSSQLLPTAVARLLIELVPLDKQPSLLQDFLFDATSGNLRQHLWRRRFLYGNSTLNDISPRQVAQLINAMISMQAQFDFYQGADESDPLRDYEEMERAFAGEIAPQIDAWRARLESTLRLGPKARLGQFLRRMAAKLD